MARKRKDIYVYSTYFPDEREPAIVNRMPVLAEDVVELEQIMRERVKPIFELAAVTMVVANETQKNFGDYFLVCDADDSPVVWVTKLAFAL